MAMNHFGQRSSTDRRLGQNTLADLLVVIQNAQPTTA
jgi:hypothetical protein